MYMDLKRNIRFHFYPFTPPSQRLFYFGSNRKENLIHMTQVAEQAVITYSRFIHIMIDFSYGDLVVLSSFSR